MFAEVLARLEEIADVTSGDPDALDAPTRRELSDLVDELARVRGALDAVEGLSLHRWAESLAFTEDGMRTPVAWLKHHTSVRGGTAARRLAAGKFLARHRSVVPLLAAGEITFDHVESLRRVDLPRVRDQFSAHLSELLGIAVDLPADEFAAVCRQWLSLADQDGTDDAQRCRFERRSLHLNQLLDGNWRLDATLPDDVGASLAEELGRIEKALHDAERAAVAEDPDLALDHTPTQRRADAFAELVRQALSVDEHSSVAPRPSLSLIVERDQLAAGAPAVSEAGDWLSAATVRAAWCDSEIWSIVRDARSIPINLGRTARLASQGQRKVVIARDRTCVWKGCDAPPGRCKVHHMDEWDADDGPTDERNLCLLCDFHHGLVHHGGWKIWRDPHSGRIEIARPDGRPPPGRRCRSHPDRRRTSQFLADPQARTEARLAQRRPLQLAA